MEEIMGWQIAKKKKVGKEDENEDERDNSMRLTSSMKCNVPNLIHHLPQHEDAQKNI
jgi:hypothetical protein